MALSLYEYNQRESEYRIIWVDEADALEKDIDAKLIRAISDNLVPNTKNQNYVLRYEFAKKVSSEAKDILRVRYGNAGWKIVENADWKDGLSHGYFDFYKTK